MISDDERREVAQKLRNAVECHKYDLNDDPDYSPFTAFSVFLGMFDRFPRYSDLFHLADLIEPCPIDGETSDGYHTFNELYHHRAVLFSVIVATFGERAWKSKLHADGTMYDGMFIVGIETPDGQATYHYDIDPYWNLFRCTELGRAPEWDGHTPNQAIERIGKLAGITGCPTCEMESRPGARYSRSRGDAAQAVGEVVGSLRYHAQRMASIPPKVAVQLAERLERAVGEL